MELSTAKYDFDKNLLTISSSTNVKHAVMEYEKEQEEFNRKENKRRDEQAILEEEREKKRIEKLKNREMQKQKREQEMIEKQEMRRELENAYLSKLSEKKKRAFYVAKTILGDSFVLEQTHGYIQSLTSDI